MPKSGGLGFKKAAREVFSKVDKVQELNKVNPDMTFLVDWNSVLNLPTDLKWTARREELDAQHNPNDTQSNGCNPNLYSVKGDELHVTLEGNLPELMEAIQVLKRKLQD